MSESNHKQETIDTVAPIQDKTYLEDNDSKTPAELKANHEQDNRPELVSESEYHTASEFQPEFQSDHEPPQDQLFEAKLIVKHNNLRVYKKILKLGIGSFMPAKYDKIEYRWKETDDENLDFKILEDSPFEKGQMGRIFLNLWHHYSRSGNNILFRESKEKRISNI